MDSLDPRGVEDVTDLIKFSRNLRQDLLENPGAWENADLGRFLEAMAAWLTDYTQGMQIAGKVVQADWRLLPVPDGPQECGKNVPLPSLHAHAVRSHC